MYVFTGSIGPKISCCNNSLSSGRSKTTVGSIKFSFSSEAPPIAIVAFLDMASSNTLLTVQNVFDSQVRMIKKAIEKMHEDLQYDYELELNNLLNNE